MHKKHKTAHYIALSLISLLFVIAAIPKLLAQPEAVAGFTVAGLPLWFVYLIGIAELLGAIGLWIPKVRAQAKQGLGLILVGAVVLTAIFVGFLPSLLPLVVLIVLASL